MVKKNDVYYCEVCGNVVEVMHAGGGDLVCCGQPMVLKKPNFEEAATEKHIPVIEKTDKGIIVKVGEVPHPMEKEHYIMWIEVTLTNGHVVRADLKPGDAPEMLVCDCKKDVCTCEVKNARAYCNIHGLWQSAE